MMSRLEKRTSSIYLERIKAQGKSWLRIMAVVGLLSVVDHTAYAQTYPVQATTQLAPPYSIFLSDYVTPGSEQLKLNLFLRDLTEPVYDVRLRLTIEGQGISITSDPTYNPPPITVESGVATWLGAEDLSGYFDVSHLVFSGYSRSAFQSSGRLPEGYYRFCFTVYDYQRPDVQLSNESCSNVWLVQPEPPMLNQPVCDTELTIEGQQMVVFQWTAMSTSPNSSYNTDYIFRLYEIRPEERAPADIVASSQPIYEIQTSETSLLYGITEPTLQEGMGYVWQVQAVDLMGRDRFKNNGYSQVCTFRVAEEESLLPEAEELVARALTDRAAKVRWIPSVEPDGYTVSYRLANNDQAEWFNEELPRESGVALADSLYVILRDLMPNTEYEVKVGSQRGDYVNTWTETKTFTTYPTEEYACGEEVAIVQPTNTTPLATAMVGDELQIGAFTMRILRVSGGDGVFTGLGAIEVPFLGTNMAVKFEGIRVNELGEVIDGEANAIKGDMEAFLSRWDSTEEDTDTADDTEPAEGETGDEEETEILYEGEIDSVYVSGDEIVVVAVDGTETTYARGEDDAGDTETTRITDSNGDSWVVDEDGKVSKGGTGNGNTGETGTNQPDQREELITEILQYLEQTIAAWQDDNVATLVECIPTNNDLLNPVLEQIATYQNNAGELLTKYSSEDQSTLSDHVSTYNEAENPANYQDALSDEAWETITCRTYSYLNDLAQGIGEVTSTTASKSKLEDLISSYRAAYKQGLNNFTLKATDFGNVNPTDYSIKGVSSVKVGLVDDRESDDYEPTLSTNYIMEDVTGQQDIAGSSFENSIVFQFGKANWSFMDAPKFLMYAYHSEPAEGLDSKTLLKDYLPGKYDYEAVQNFINKIIDSHDKGEETLDVKKELAGEQVYARNVDFGDKGMYDVYISRTGDFSDDKNSFYGYTKTEVTEVMGFSGTYSEYKFFSASGGITYMTIPQTQSKDFEKSVLKLHMVHTGTPYLDLVKAIRAANLNADTKLEITEYGSEGGISPVFEIDHDGEKLKMMVVYPLLGNRKNKIDPSNRPSPATGQTDNAMGEAGSWVVYEFQNQKGKDAGHNTKIYVMEKQMDLFESYLLIAQEVLITGITWRSQFDDYFKGRTCYPNKACCMQAALEMIKQFNVTTSSAYSKNIATLVAPSKDYNSISPTSEFEAQVEYINKSIKSNKQGGKPVLVGVHYDKGVAPYNTSNSATYHFIVLVGKGYDKEKRKYYYRFYEVGTSDKSAALSESNRLYIDTSTRLIRGTYKNKTYTITEVRQNQ